MAAQPVVCVFCASSPGTNPAHLESARSLSLALCDAGYKVVYGGGTNGIMGELAKTVVRLTSPENVEGIIPRALIGTKEDPAARSGLPAGKSTATESADTKQAERVVSQAALSQIDGADAIPASEFGKTTIVGDMHTRKRMMADRVAQGGPGSGFIALGGGYGTLEEVMEATTWNQLGIHKLPVVIVNIDGYWDGLLDWVKRSIKEGFIAPGNANILVEVKDPKDAVDALRNYKVAAGRFKLDWGQE